LRWIAWTNSQMPKAISSFELTLSSRPDGKTLTTWLYTELRLAILDGRLAPDTRLPASRDFASLHGLSRGTVVSVFERLHSEGYLSSRVGRGTWVNGHIQSGNLVQRKSLAQPLFIRHVAAAYTRPKPFEGLIPLGNVPFRMRDPALAEFPAKLWRRIASHRARTFNPSLPAEDDGCGYRPLREAVRIT
jgi:GntR family transcriptional regulator/MocR family aminotransferase